MKGPERADYVKWRKLTFKERFLLCRGIRKNNFRCLLRLLMYSFFPCILLAFGAFWIHWILSAVLAGLYLLGVLIYGFSLDRKCLRIWFGHVRCTDAACYGRDEEYQYTVNGFSYFINVFRLTAGNDKQIFKLPAYRRTFLFANGGDNLLAVRFGKNDIRCFSKKELGLTSHKAKAGSWSKLSKQEVSYVIKQEREKLREARIIFGVDFTVMAAFSIFMLANFIYFFPYAITLLFGLGVLDALRIRRYAVRIRKLRRIRINALKNSIVSCFLIRKPTGRGGFHYVYYLKIMHPETGKFRIEKLRQFTWASTFDNEVSDNIIVVDYSKRRRGRSMQHYIIEEYGYEAKKGSDI